MNKQPTIGNLSIERIPRKETPKGELQKEKMNLQRKAPKGELTSNEEIYIVWKFDFSSEQSSCG